MANPAIHPELLPSLEAFRFRAATDAAKVSAAVDGKRRSFEGVAYSGELITGHFYWDRVIFDLTSTRASNRLPVLIDHDRSRRAGYAQLAIDGDRIIARGELLTNEHGAAIAQDADDGFPWQMSVHIEPERVERLEPGIKATVNGREIVGPAHIFRSNTIREVSFTPTGADGGTSAKVFSVPVQTAHQETHPVAHNTDAAAELRASLDAANAQIEALKARAEAAETALREHQFAVRAAEVKTLFSDLGRQYSDDAAKPYLEMSAEAFETVSRDLRSQFAATSRRPGRELPAYLFYAQATGDAELSEAERIAAHVNRPKVSKP